MFKVERQTRTHMESDLLNYIRNQKFVLFEPKNTACLDFSYEHIVVFYVYNKDL